MAHLTEDLLGLGRQLERFFACRLPQGADAEDLAQETLVRALANWGQLRKPEARRAWAFGIAYNVLRDQYRRAERHPVALHDAPDGVVDDGSPGWRAAIREAVALSLESISANQQRVIVLRLIEGLSFAQIGRSLGIPEATARTRAFHGLRRLRATVATCLRQEGWLLECQGVRERLLRMAFGISEARVEEEIRRHLMTCAECQREIDVVCAMRDGVMATAKLPVLVGGWAVHDLQGNATSYWLTEVINPGGTAKDEWESASSIPPDRWSWFDAKGRPLEEIRHWHDDGVWRVRLRLHAPWQPGTVERVVGAAPLHLDVITGQAAWTVKWSEEPLPEDNPIVSEIVCRRVLQLPVGYHAVDAAPEPDHQLTNGSLLLWSMVMTKGERLRLKVTFAHN